MSQLQDNLEEILRQKNTYLLPANLKKDVSLLGVTGTYEGIDTSDADATADEIARGKTAYVNGQKITGTLVNGNNAECVAHYEYLKNDALYFRHNLDSAGYSYYYPTRSNIILFCPFNALRSVIGLTEEKIKAGETILGITGTYTGEISQEEYDTIEATLDDLLTGEYEDVYDVMNEVTDTPEDSYNGVGGTPTQIENTINALLGVNN